MRYVGTDWSAEVVPIPPLRWYRFMRYDGTVSPILSHCKDTILRTQNNWPYSKLIPNSGYKSIFGNDEAADIKNVMRSYGDTKEQHQAIGTWLCDYADSRQSFDEIKNRQTYKEVADVANGAYDWKIERGQRGISL